MFLCNNKQHQHKDKQVNRCNDVLSCAFSTVYTSNVLFIYVFYIILFILYKSDTLAAASFPKKHVGTCLWSDTSAGDLRNK